MTGASEPFRAVFRAPRSRHRRGVDLSTGADMLTKPPFVPVEPEVFLAAGMPSRADAERESARWLDEMASGAGELSWAEAAREPSSG